jgi:predicted RNA-binding protein with TRAM domain
MTPCGTVTFPAASAASFLTFTPDVRNGKPVRINLTMVAKIGAC